MLTLKQKEKIITTLKGHIERSQGIFLTNLVGVEANAATQVRKQIRDVQGAIVITRNTLFSRAAQGTACESILSDLKGENAVAFAFEDAAAVAKVLNDAAKEYEPVKFKKGILEGKELSAAELVELANLPSRDEMLATLLATFNAPVSAFVRVMNSIREKKEEGGAAVEVKAESEASTELPTTEPTVTENLETEDKES